MTPKEIAEKIEKGIAGIPRWRMFWDFKVGDLADFVADYKRQSELLEEARKLADMAIDCVTTDVTMQGPRVTGINGSASRRASEMARSFLAKLEAQP